MCQGAPPVEGGVPCGVPCAAGNRDRPDASASGSVARSLFETVMAEATFACMPSAHACSFPASSTVKQCEPRGPSLQSMLSKLSQLARAMAIATTSPPTHSFGLFTPL